MTKEKKTQEEQSEFAWEGGNTKEEESEFNWEGTSSTNNDKQAKKSQKEKPKNKMSDEVATEETNTSSNLNMSNQPVTNNVQLDGKKVFAVIILMIGIVIAFIVIFFDSDPFGDRAGDAEYAKDKALEYFEGPNTTYSQLQCEPKELVGDLILVKCETTDKDVINYYGSSTLWYGLLFKADRENYSYYGNSSREEVINHFNK